MTSQQLVDVLQGIGIIVLSLGCVLLQWQVRDLRKRVK